MRHSKSSTLSIFVIFLKLFEMIPNHNFGILSIAPSTHNFGVVVFVVRPPRNSIFAVQQAIQNIEILIFASFFKLFTTSGNVNFEMPKCALRLTKYCDFRIVDFS